SVGSGLFVRLGAAVVGHFPDFGLFLLPDLGGYRCGDEFAVEGQPGDRRVPGGAGVVAGEPVQDVEQLDGHAHRVLGFDRAGAVHGGVALAADEVHFGADRRTGQVDHGGFGDPRGQVALV